MKGNCILMHKNDEVLKLKLANNRVNEVEVINEKLIPPTINTDTETSEGLMLEVTRWLQKRANFDIPEIKDIKDLVNSKIFDLAGKISLYDTYWVKQNSDENWENINPYDNWDSKKDPLVKLYVNPLYFNKNNVINSPNFAIPKWNNNIFFYKQGEKIFKFDKNILKAMTFSKKNLENEVVKRRQCVIINEKIYAASLTSSDKNTEIFSLFELFNASRPEDEETMDNVLDFLETLGFPKEKTLSFFKKVYEADEKINKEDRGLESIYIKRDSDTLNYIGFAEI